MPPALSLEGVSKRFGGVHALADVDFEVAAGEVHGLLGENGSGKSTLIKILAGFHEPDEGSLQINGRPVSLPVPVSRFREYGLSFVHQDLALLPTLTVVENLRTGLIAGGNGVRFISWRAETRRAREIFARYGVSIDPRATVGDLRPVDRALLAIVRAIEEVRAEHDGLGILVLDEPTVFLPRAEVEHLFELVREIAASGSSVLLVSHDLEEIREVTDRVTVLRDGRVVGTSTTATTSEAQLVEMIIGRELLDFSVDKGDANAGDAARVEGLSGPGVDDVSLAVGVGEVVGLTGLAGSGFEAVPYLVFGAWPAGRGTLTIGDQTLNIAGMLPRRALREGIVLIPGDRQRDGAVLPLSVADNVTLPRLPQFWSGLRLQRGSMRRETDRLMDEYDVRPAGATNEYGSLSGGNQQKALLAKWLNAEPRLLLFHEPTQGVDVGARQQIFGTIRDSAANGASVLCASSDHEQLAAICDRVLVFGRGRIAGELTGADVTKDRITERCYRAATPAEAA